MRRRRRRLRGLFLLLLLRLRLLLLLLLLGRLSKQVGRVTLLDREELCPILERVDGLGLPGRIENFWFVVAGG